MKKIAYITGARADFGIEAPLLNELEKSNDFRLQLYVTGIHLMPEFGNSFDLVKEMFPKVKIIDAWFTKDGMATFAAKFSTELVQEFRENRPDLVLVHGDRVEMLCTTMISLYLGIPVAHVQGGDKTATFDDSARHAITKMSHLHFPAIKESAERIKLMGEEEWRIKVVGTLGLDALLRVKTLKRHELCKKLSLPLDSKIILVLQHPVSEEVELSRQYMKNIISAVKRFNLPTVIIYPNADSGSDQIREVINEEKENPLFKIFKNLDYRTFVSLEKEADVWIGNSSAGIIESASFGTPVVNVGIRQNGRQRGINVIDVGNGEEVIYQAINRSLYNEKYLKSLENCINPWGDGCTVKRIMEVLRTTRIDNQLLVKK